MAPVPVFTRVTNSEMCTPVLPPLPCQRSQFDLPEDVIYLNAASRSPLASVVERVGVDALREKSQPWRLADSDATAERTRVLFARVVGAREGGEDSVAITPSTSYAISQAAVNLEPLVRAAAAEAPAGGCDVLVLQDQMSSNVYAWQARRHAPAHMFLLHAGTGG